MHSTVIIALLTLSVVATLASAETIFPTDQPLVGGLDNIVSIVRARRHNVVTDHARQVMEAMSKYEKERNGGKRADNVRMKREFFATLSPEQYNDMINLHAMSIKRNHPESAQ